MCCTILASGKVADFLKESALVTEHSYATLILFSLSLSCSLYLKLFDPDRQFLPTPKLHTLESYWVNHTEHLCPRNIHQYHCYLVGHSCIFLISVTLQRTVAWNLLHASKSTNLKWFKCSLLAFLIVPSELYENGFYIGECQCRGKLICYQYASLSVNVCQTWSSPFSNLLCIYTRKSLQTTLPCMYCWRCWVFIQNQKLPHFLTNWRCKEQWCSWYLCITFSTMVA